MIIEIKKGTAKGRIEAPPSKSMAHRLLICAALSEGVSTIRGISKCEDVLATLECLLASGVKAEFAGNDVIVYGCDVKKANPANSLFCRESGSTLRFLIPVAMLSGNETTFCGAEGLMRRPMMVYENLFAEKGHTYIQNGDQISVRGPLTSGEYTIPGDVSSQFISGLIFALPLVAGYSVIHITPPIESRSYIDLTIEALKQFGVIVAWLDENTIGIKGNQSYVSRDVTVEGDYSGAAFLEALNLFGGKVETGGLNPESTQADAVYRKHFRALNADAAAIYLDDCPDLAPILFAVAAAKHGGTFHGTRRLKIKESDRAESMATELRKFGATVEVNENSVVIEPTAFHKPTQRLCGHNDHRIVMALSILLTLTGGEIDEAEAVAKSYPDFFE
ncbi:MAG: 3-phosphoshikimate 1-carboxyvinyltransferase, partial [Clostridia bacterium]|nr:3-phosphoshikimate 1-carboxyvinyltransferase [Clostridia bacterium]